jgi:hypothetical protein
MPVFQALAAPGATRSGTSSDPDGRGHRLAISGNMRVRCASLLVAAIGWAMLDGVMLLWFLLTAAALLFVAVDIRSTPESPVLKWGFILLTAYTGVVGAFLYVLGCREPLPGLHERYVAAGRFSRRCSCGTWSAAPTARTDQHLRIGAAINEPSHGWNGTDSDGAQGTYRTCGRSHSTRFLVRDVHGTPGRVHLCLSHELVAGGSPSQARHDDGASGRLTCR